MFVDKDDLKLIIGYLDTFSQFHYEMHRRNLYDEEEQKEYQEEMDNITSIINNYNNKLEKLGE